MSLLDTLIVPVTYLLTPVTGELLASVRTSLHDTMPQSDTIKTCAVSKADFISFS